MIMQLSISFAFGWDVVQVDLLRILQKDAFILFDIIGDRRLDLATHRDMRLSIWCADDERTWTSHSRMVGDSNG